MSCATLGSSVNDGCIPIRVLLVAGAVALSYLQHMVLFHFHT